MRHRSNIFGLFGDRKTAKPAASAPSQKMTLVEKTPVDPTPFYERAAALSRRTQANHYLVQAPAKDGHGNAWYWITVYSPGGFDAQELERTRGGMRVPKGYWQASSPWETVRDNLDAFREPEQEKFVYIDTYTEKVEGPLTLADIRTRKNTNLTPKALVQAVRSDLLTESSGKSSGLLAWLDNPKNRDWAESYAKATLTGKMSTQPEYQPMRRFDVALEGKNLREFNADVSKVLLAITRGEFRHAPFPSMDFYTPGALANKDLEKAWADLIALKPRNSKRQEDLVELQKEFTFWFVAPNTLDEAHERWVTWKNEREYENPLSVWAETPSSAWRKTVYALALQDFADKNLKKWGNEHAERREKIVGGATVFYASALDQYLGGPEPQDDADPKEPTEWVFDEWVFDEEPYDGSNILYEARFVFWLMRVILKDLFSEKCVGAERLEKAGEIRKILRSFDDKDYAGFIERLFTVADSVNACAAGQTSFLFGLSR